MKYKIAVSVVICSIIFLPALSPALEPVGDLITWTDYNYSAYAKAWLNETDYVVDISNGPPLPVNAYACYADPACATSYIDDSYMNVRADDWESNTFSVLTETYARSEFTGTYTASDSYFNFSYLLSYYTLEDHYLGDFWITITDVDTSNILFASDGSAQSTFSVPTIYGHDIEVNFGLSAFHTYRIDEDASLDYQMGSSMVPMGTVVPEPISSILFITGGTLLAGRKYMRRKNI